MKKLFTLALCVFFHLMSHAGSSASNTYSESSSDGQTVRTRALAGNTLTESVCVQKVSGENTHSHCVAQSTKLSSKDALRAQGSFQHARASVLASRDGGQVSFSSSRGESISRSMQVHQQALQQAAFSHMGSTSRTAVVSAVISPDMTSMSKAISQ